MVKHYLVRAISAVAFAGLAVSVASADTIFNYDQNNGNSGTQTDAAVVGSTGDIWNANGSGTVTNMTLLNTTGSSAGGTLTLNAGAVTGSGGGVSTYTDPGNTKMDAATTPLMKDYAYGGGSGGSLTQTISGLSNLTGQTYTLYIYAAGNANGQGSLITLSGTGVSNTGASATTTAVDRKLSNGVGDAYQVFTGTITGDSFTITEAGHGGGSNGILNGFQLDIAPVPEPATWIAGAACLGLSMVALRRRRQTT